MIKVINVISDTNIGGAGRLLLTYLAHADKENFDISVVLPKNSLLKPHLETLCIKFFEIDAMSDKSLDFKAISELKEIFKREKPDIVHSHASMSARIAARSVGCKVIYTRHSVFPPSPYISKGIGKKINGAVNNYYADGIIAVAEAAKQNLLDTGVCEDKIKVILNGVEPLNVSSEEKKAKTRKLFNISDDEKVVAIVARLNPVKGHEYFIRAAKIVSDAGINAKFIVAGTGDIMDSLKQLASEINISDKIVFAGFVDDVESLMNICDIQINASYGTEATSLSLLEGMSLGVAAVVSDFGGNPGVISDGQNGFIVPQKAPQAIADAIIKLFSDDSLMESIKNGAKEIFAQKFTAEIMSRNIENYYVQIFGNGGNKNE